MSYLTHYKNYILVRHLISEFAQMCSLKVTEFDLGESYDQPFEKSVLPQSLKELKFPPRFNEPLQNDVLPHALERLTIGDRFNQVLLSGVLPQSLKHLYFGSDFNHPMGKGCYHLH